MLATVLRFRRPVANAAEARQFPSPPPEEMKAAMNETKDLGELGRVERITILGGGTMGRGCAQVFAAAGYPVSLQSRRAETLANAMEMMKHDLIFLADRGVGKHEDVEATLARVTTTQDLAEALDGADFVLENVAESMALKQEYFQKMDALTPPTTVLATNTSVMSISEIARPSKNRERMVGAHWWNPPTLIPLVEVVRHDEVADWAAELTMKLMAKIGKRPILVQKDVPGFVANRLQHALWREAISIVERGIADAATVDEAMKAGPGFRLAQLAPLENADMGGLDMTLAIHDYVLKHLEDSHEPSPLLKEKVVKGELGFKTGGKGFQEWTPAQQMALRNGLLEYLCEQTVMAQRKKAR